MSAALTLAPMPPGVAKAWHALQAEMLKETRGLDVVPPGAIVLSQKKAGFRFGAKHDQMGFLSIVGDENSSSDQYTNYLKMPKGWESFWNPAHWLLQRHRTDASGNKWTSQGGTYVVDDFGFLVEVAS